MPKKPKKLNRGCFRKGHDPRRHKFTSEECQRGYESAVESMIEKHPDWVCQHGAHYSHCLLRVKNPLWFEVRKLKAQVKRLETKVGKHDVKLRGIQRELRKLQKQAGYDPAKTTKPRGGSDEKDYIH